VFAAGTATAAARPSALEALAAACFLPTTSPPSLWCGIQLIPTLPYSAGQCQEVMKYTGIPIYGLQVRV